MTKIFSCTVTYNDKDMLVKNIESVKPFVDGFVIVDGAFPGFPLKDASSISTDGTRALVETQIPKEKLTYIEGPKTGWKSQSEARTQYLKAVPPGDWIFVLDSDETACGDLVKGFDRVKTSKFLSVAVLCESLVPTWKGKGNVIPKEVWRTLPTAHVYGYMVRLYRSSGNLEYRLHHSVVFDTGLGLSLSRITELMESGVYMREFRIINDKHGQSWERYQAGNTYREKRATPL